jgi:hypothetical protein
MVTAAEPSEQVVRHLRVHLGDDPAWAEALDRLDARSGPATSLHLAVMVEPFLGLLLAGAKTMESRFSRVRCAPWGVLNPGDVVVLKKTGGPITGAFVAGKVLSISLDPQDPNQIAAVRSHHAAAICATDEQFWVDRADTKVATLAEVTAVRAVPALPFAKKDRRGWVVLTSTSAAGRWTDCGKAGQPELPWTS